MFNESNMSTNYKDLNEFLAKHSAKDKKGIVPTHTRIPNKELKIYGGSYIIPDEELDVFNKLYYDHVFVQKKKEYLTEKQQDGRCMAVDFDFRYSSDIIEKQHSFDHIQDMIILYLEELKKCFIFKENSPFDIFIFEKEKVNKLEDNSLTKDGIHMLICLKIDYVFQEIIRENMITLLSESWELPLINKYDSVLDEGISKGVTNWQLYGSRKPNHDAYSLKNHFIITYDSNDGEFMMDEIKVENFDLKNDFYKLSVRNVNNPKFDTNPSIQEEYNRRANSSKPKPRKHNSRTKINLLVEEEENESISLNNITSKESLDKAVKQMIDSFTANEFEILEVHKFTQILPEKFYEPGSHLLNRQVAFALKNTDDRLFLSWVQLRSKASDFDYSTIPELYGLWKKFSKANKSNKSVTKKSILYWAKHYNYEAYEEVKKESIDNAIEESLISQTEYDKAQVLKQMYKDKYVCVSYDKKGVWYVYKNHRWFLDKGLSLREAISKKMYNLYTSKSEKLNNEWYHFDPTDERAEFIKKKIKVIGEIMITLKKTNDKNNIMREAMELFYDGEFIKNMNSKKDLLCFNNGVVDLKSGEFREGYPDDYITKTTNVDYQPFDEAFASDSDFKETAGYCLDFMDKLFPIKDLNRYMWDHLASTLIGTNLNQTFNVYHGSGSNGKSMLTDLMSYALGDYKGTVPITLVTEKRGLIGGTSSEVLQLKGVRYAVMQEPSKAVKLNEGVMKELTGGDPIQARGLYSESEIFEPQFSLVVCTNNLFEIESNDDGTWRRIRKVNFLSKFVDKNETYNDESDFVFDKDYSLKDKFPQMAPVFISMLVKRVIETKGIVENSEIVMEASNEYRKGQDFIAAFVAENIEKTDDNKDRIKKKEISEHFKSWFQQEQGNRKMPKGQELYDYMDKKLCKHKTTGWHGYKIIYSNDDIDDLDEI
jgi:P4 family phage/plasmid primase-like protien